MGTNLVKFTNRQTGFTLIELVVVIVLLGLLAATALPRFLNVTDQARQASLEGMSGGFAAGVAMVRAKWISDGNSTGKAGIAVMVDGGAIYVNENGWPAKTSSAVGAGSNDQTAIECQQVWNFVLQSPPSSTTTVLNNERYYISVVGLSPNLCRFSINVNGVTDVNRYFDYNLGSGQVIISPST